jgi:hypothetical protein
MNSTSRGCRLVRQRREIAGPLEHRTGSLAQVHAELARQDFGKRGLAETGRSEDEGMIERFAAPDRRLHEDLHLRLDPAPGPT